MGVSQLPDVRAAAEEVKRSMELVEQVGELMRHRSKGETGGLEIVGKVLNSLSAVLGLLSVSGGVPVKDEGGESAWTAGSHCSESVGGKSGGRRRGAAAAAKKGGGRRSAGVVVAGIVRWGSDDRHTRPIIFGSYERSRPYYCRKTTSATVNDGFMWRKYGQKDIQSSKYPRNYFRCTYKYSKECQAIKQVQICEDDPSSFLVTYIGQHTCRSIPASVADETKPLPEPGEASPRLETSAITTAVELKIESNGEATDRLDCRESEDLWSGLELHFPETARSSPLSSSSIYGGDIGMFASAFDVNSFLDFTGSCGA